MLLLWHAHTQGDVHGEHVLHQLIHLLADILLFSYRQLQYHKLHHTLIRNSEFLSLLLLYFYLHLFSFILLLLIIITLYFLQVEPLYYEIEE